MRSETKVIDYLDVTVAIPQSSVPLFRAWMLDFESEHSHIERAPRLVDRGQLNINSSDLIAFLGYIDPSEWNDFQSRRFKAEVRKAFEQLLLKSTSLGYQNHYKWCLSALTSFELGRFRRTSEN